MSDRSIGVVDILILYENAAMRGRDTHHAGGRTVLMGAELTA